jgi:DeoR family glycerol-3-phosphate regulon repressor
MSKMDRKQHIMEAARRNGQVMVEGLAEDLGVSTHTIRRDINQLCEESKLRRLRGGAVYLEEHVNLPYQARAVLNFDAKTAIAQRVAELIPDGTTIFISIGTTPAIVAAALAQKQSLTIITNNLNAALALSENQSNRIILPGGELRLPDRDILGRAAVDIFSNYRADYAIYGVGGIDIDGSLLDFNVAEVQMREQMRINARRSILVADRTKFGRRTVAVGGTFNEADIAVIDGRPAPSFEPLLDSYPGQLILAMEETDA